MLDIRLFVAKNRALKFDYQKMNKLDSNPCSKNDGQIHSKFDEMLFDLALLFS